MNLKQFPSLQFVIMDQISLLSPLGSNDWSIPLRIFVLKQIFVATCIFLHKIDYLHGNLCKYFEADMKLVMRRNIVCEYTKTCEYEANKIHIRLDSLRSE